MFHKIKGFASVLLEEKGRGAGSVTNENRYVYRLSPTLFLVRDEQARFEEIRKIGFVATPKEGTNRYDIA